MSHPEGFPAHLIAYTFSLLRQAGRGLYRAHHANYGFSVQ